MRCPKCGATKSSVVDSRQAEEGNTIRHVKLCALFRFFSTEPRFDNSI